MRISFSYMVVYAMLFGSSVYGMQKPLLRRSASQDSLIVSINSCMSLDEMRENLLQESASFKTKNKKCKKIRACANKSSFCANKCTLVVISAFLMGGVFYVSSKLQTASNQLETQLNSASQDIAMFQNMLSFCKGMVQVCTPCLAPQYTPQNTFDN